MPSAFSTVSRWTGNRAASVLAGASGTSTGTRVASFTNSATCGFQNDAVEYQLSSAVDGVSTGSVSGAFTRSRSFFVAWIVNMTRPV